jgi:pimeloyl-ACP methyl ester carboxylesterase
MRSLVPRSVLGRSVVGASLLYAACTGLLWALHRSFIFPAPKSGLEPTLSGATTLKLDAEGDDIVALWAPPPSDAKLQDPKRRLDVGRAGVVVFFHGNAQELVDLSWLARALMNRGLGVMMVEYPGYGLAKGRPTERSLYFAARRALDELARLGVTRDQITLVGQSLGSGVAMEMARGGYGSKLVLLSPFTSMVDMVKRFTPLLPTGALVKDRFANLEKAGEIEIETLVIHGSDDRLVPASMGRELAGAIRGARFVAIDGHGHNDLFQARAAGSETSEVLELIVGAARREQPVSRPNPLAN